MRLLGPLCGRAMAERFPDSAEDDDYDPMADDEEKDEAKPDPVFEKDDIDVVKGSLQQLAGMSPGRS